MRLDLISVFSLSLFFSPSLVTHFSALPLLQERQKGGWGGITSVLGYDRQTGAAGKWQTAPARRLLCVLDYVEEHTRSPERRLLTRV